MPLVPVKVCFNWNVLSYKICFARISCELAPESLLLYSEESLKRTSRVLDKYVIRMVRCIQTEPFLQLLTLYFRNDHTQSEKYAGLSLQLVESIITMSST